MRNTIDDFVSLGTDAKLFSSWLCQSCRLSYV